jgi:uncharacterized protein (UPF0261 family)
MRTIYAIATLDTKGEELAYVAEQVRRAGGEVTTVDVGTKDPPQVRPDVPREAVAGGAVSHTDRGAAVAAMAEALAAWLLGEHAAGRVAGVIGLGGSGGTALIAPAMRALPVGVPKLLVSTVASGNTAAYVGCSDVTMVFSVTDVAGLNRVSRVILGNAARAIAAMATGGTSAETHLTEDKPAVAMTMFGVTTPCVTAVRRALEPLGYDCLTFHATGAGGQAMEKLVESDLIGGVIDLTTTEVADLVAGGIMPCLPTRFDVTLAKRVPFVLSLGAVDMVNFGPRDSVPARYEGRLFHVHNPQITLMRTTPDENRQIARFIAGKLNRSTAPVTLLIPEGGLSALDAPGQPFHDPAASAALFDELAARIEQTADRRVVRLPLHINDPAFAEAVVGAFQGVAGRHGLVARATSPSASPR